MFSIKYLILIYFHTFLLIDIVNGFVLKYLGVEPVVSPGQIMRGILVGFLLIELFKINKVNKYNIYIFGTLLFAPLIIFLHFLSIGSINVIPTEIISFLKPLLFLLLLFHVFNHYNYYKKYIDQILLVNLLIFSSTIYFGYFTGFGLNPYDLYYNASKSFFYGSNPTSVLGFSFCIYYTFKVKYNKRNIVLLGLAISALFFSGSQIILVYPIFLSYYIFFKIYSRFSIKILSISIILLICILFFSGVFKYTIFTDNILFDRYKNRALNSLIYFNQKEEISITPLRWYSYVSGLRAIRADGGLNNIKKDFSSLIFGYGSSMRSEIIGGEYGGKEGSEMDFIDIFLDYGIIGFLLIYIPIFRILIPLVIKRDTGKTALIIYFIFIYSSLAGHVITAPMAGSLFALFLGLEYGKFNDIKLLGNNKKKIKLA